MAYINSTKSTIKQLNIFNSLSSFLIIFGLIELFGANLLNAIVFLLIIDLMILAALFGVKIKDTILNTEYSDTPLFQAIFTSKVSFILFYSCFLVAWLVASKLSG